MCRFLSIPSIYITCVHRLQRTLHSICSARLLLNLREASIRSTILVDGNTVESSTASTSRISSVRFQPDIERHAATSTIFSVDDGVWVSGGHLKPSRVEHGGGGSVEMMSFDSSGEIIVS